MSWHRMNKEPLSQCEIEIRNAARLFSQQAGMPVFPGKDADADLPVLIEAKKEYAKVK